jgi:hypothetical protein
MKAFEDMVRGTSSIALPSRDGISTPRVTDLIDRALQAERFGRFDEARATLRQAILGSQPPEAIDFRLRLAKLLISGGPP